MTPVELASFMEENWSSLERELANNWPTFLQDYKRVANTLTAPDRDKLELATTKLLDLILKYERSSALLKARFKRKERIITKLGRSGAETLEDNEQINITANRFLSLPTEPKSPSKSRSKKDLKKKIKEFNGE